MNKIELKIGSKTYIFFFGLGFLGELIEEMNVTLESLMEKINRNPFKYLPLMMFRSIEYGYTRKGQVIDFNQYDFADILQNNGGINSDEVVSFLEAFTKSISNGADMDKKVPLVNEVKKS